MRQATISHGEAKTIILLQAEMPLIRIAVRGHVADGDFQEYLLASDRVLAAGKPYVLLYDVLGGLGVSPVQRRMQTDWIQRNRPSLELLCKGAVFAVSNGLMRGVLTAVFWMAPVPFETAVVETLGAAERRAYELLRRGGLVVKDTAGLKGGGYVNDPGG